jgi:hypothetical protein
MDSLLKEDKLDLVSGLALRFYPFVQPFSVLDTLRRPCHFPKRRLCSIREGDAYRRSQKHPGSVSL